MKKFNLNTRFFVFKGNLSEWLEKMDRKKAIQLVKKACQKIPGIIFLEENKFEIVIPSPEVDLVEIRTTIQDNFKGLNVVWAE